MQLLPYSTCANNGTTGSDFCQLLWSETFFLPSPHVHSHLSFLFPSSPFPLTSLLLLLLHLPSLSSPSSPFPGLHPLNPTRPESDRERCKLRSGFVGGRPPNSFWCILSYKSLLSWQCCVEEVDSDWYIIYELVCYYLWIITDERDEKINYYRQDCPKGRSAGIVLLTGRFFGFSPSRGDSLHRSSWNLAGRLLLAKFQLVRFGSKV